MKRNRKGFTIVELVIVIAVIAILAAVLIPTFSSLIQKANLSADEQAVRSMNTALMADEAINGKPSNLGEARAVLAAAGYNAESYHPISAGHNFYWDAELNCILLVKGSRETQEVVYPTEYAGAGEDFFANDTRRYNLFDGWTLGDETIVAEVDAGVTLTADEAGKEKLADIIRIGALSGETFDGGKITLAENATYDFTDSPIKTPIVKFEGTIDGNGATLKGIDITPVHGKDGNGCLYIDYYDPEQGVQKSKYGVGLFDYLGEGGLIENLTIEYSDTETTHAMPDSEYTYFGGIVGCLNGGTIRNCTVTGDIVQYNRVGGIVGSALAGTIENCSVTANITSLAVTSSTSGRTSNFEAYSYVGGIVAYVGNAGKAVNDQLTIKNCTVGKTEGTIELTANFCAVGGIFAWSAGGTDVEVSDCTIQNVSLDKPGSTGWGAGLVCGFAHADDVTIALSGISVQGCTVRMNGVVQDASKAAVKDESGNILIWSSEVAVTVQ